MAFTGGGNKAFTPFTVSASQQQNPPTATSSAPFSFASGGSSGFAFGGGASAQASASAPQLSLGGNAAPANQGSLFAFGSPATTASTPAAAVQAAPLQFGLGSAATLGGTGASNPSTGAPTGYQFSTGASSTQPTLSFGVGTPATTVAPTPTLPTTAAPATFTAVPPAAQPSVQPAFGLVTSGTSAAGLSLGLGTTTTATTTTTGTTPAPGFSFGANALNLANAAKQTPTTTAPASTTALSGSTDATASASASQLTTTTTTTQSNSTNISQMNFRQLQEAINKWMVDLQEQEKLFLDQATKVNAWDRTLISNGEKVSRLNESVTKIKGDHTRLDHALEYLKTQQQEFEGFLEPLETGLPTNIPVEPEREHLYGLTENVDTQLQQMAEDLKVVIRHINESNKTVDRNDPVSQILRILNEHTDALQWVEDNTNGFRKSLEEISKQHQNAKKDHERSFRTMFK